MTIARIIVGLDQSTGASSAFGVALYNPNTNTLLATYELRPKDKRPEWVRIQQIANQVSAILMAASVKHGPLEVRVEGVVMRGRSGQIIAWSVGAVIAHLPPFSTFAEVHNIRNKMFMTGSHNASKFEMGQGLIRFFEEKKNLASVDAVRKLVDNESWDAIDAACIAVYGASRSSDVKGVF